MAMYELYDEREDGRVVSYGCRPTDNSLIERNHSVALTFQYEVTVPNPTAEHIQLLRIELKRENIPKLEEFLLYGVKEATLKDCDLESQNVAAYDSVASGKSGAAAPRVVYLKSFAVDELVIDTPCLHFLSSDISPACFRIKGGMNASYIGEPEDGSTVESYLLHHVEEAIQTSYKHAGMDDIYFSFELENDQVESSTSGGSSPGIIGGTVSAGAILLLAFAGFMMHRRRKRRAHEEANAKHEIIMDIEQTGAPEPTESEHYEPKKAVVKDKENQITPDDRDQELPSSDQLLVPVTLTTLRTASTTTATDESEVPETASKEPLEDEIKTISVPSTEEVKMCSDPPPSRENFSPEPSIIPLVDVLPPKPPTDPSSKAHLFAAMSKPLKVRRKKKKRKKKPKMTRVSSRENINEMETIKEGAESDSDSEYSWCSTSDSNGSSRQSSPARSRGSREPSPARLSGESSPIPSTGSWDHGSGNGSSGESSDRKKAEELPPYLV